MGCGSDSSDAEGGSTDYGQKPLSSLDEACEGISGLTGQAILDQKTDSIAATLGYVMASGKTTSPTSLTWDLTWPAQPVAVCYPEHSSGAFVSEPRVAVEGLSMHFATADGKFDESISAKAWLTSQGGMAAITTVVGFASRGGLHGSWQPFPDYDNGGGMLWFVNRLYGASSSQAGGNVGLGAVTAADLGAGVFKGGNAVALWPVPP